MDETLSGDAAARFIQQQLQKHYFHLIPKPWLALATSRGISSGGKDVFIHLYDIWYRIGCKRGQVNCSYLSRMTGRSRRTIQRDLCELERAQLIRRYQVHCPQRGQLRNEYEVLLTTNNAVEMDRISRRELGHSAGHSSHSDTENPRENPSQHAPSRATLDGAHSGTSIDSDSGGIDARASTASRTLARLQKIRGRAHADAPPESNSVSPATEAFGSEAVQIVRARQHLDAVQRGDRQATRRARQAASKAAGPRHPGRLRDDHIPLLARRLSDLKLSDTQWSQIVHTGQTGWAPKTLSSSMHTLHWLVGAVRSGKWCAPKSAQNAKRRSRVLDALELSRVPSQRVTPRGAKMTTNRKILPAERFENTTPHIAAPPSPSKEVGDFVVS